MNDIYNLPNSPQSAVQSILRNGSKPGGIFSAAGFANLKSTFGIGGTPKPPGFVGPVQTGTTFKSVSESQGGKALEMAGGMMLAQQGLLGIVARNLGRRGRRNGRRRRCRLLPRWTAWRRHRRGGRIRDRHWREVGRRRIQGERSEASRKTALLHQHRQLDGKADRRHRATEIRRQCGHRGARSGCPEDADALFGGIGAEDASVGHNPDGREPRGSERQAISAGQLCERHAVHLPEQPPGCGRIWRGSYPTPAP